MHSRIEAKLMLPHRFNYLARGLVYSSFRQPNASYVFILILWGGNA